MCSVIPFLSVKDPNLQDVHQRKISAVYGAGCMCKAQACDWVMTFKTDIANLHNADRPGQAHSGRGPPVAEKSRQRGFFCLLEFRRWFIKVISKQCANLKIKGAIFL